MTDHQYHEAKRLIKSGMSIRKAAEQVGVPYTTLRRNWERIEKSQTATGPEAEPEAELEAEPWRTIRRHENETRKQQGLPPLTDEQWAAGKSAMEECERQMKHFWRQSND